MRTEEDLWRQGIHHLNSWLDLFESFERHQTELEARESLMVLNRDIQPKWEIQAFLKWRSPMGRPCL